MYKPQIYCIVLETIKVFVGEYISCLCNLPSGWLSICPSFLLAFPSSPPLLFLFLQAGDWTQSPVYVRQVHFSHSALSFLSKVFSFFSVLLVRALLMTACPRDVRLPAPEMSGGCWTCVPADSVHEDYGERDRFQCSRSLSSPSPAGNCCVFRTLVNQRRRLLSFHG